MNRPVVLGSFVDIAEDAVVLVPVAVTGEGVVLAPEVPRRIGSLDVPEKLGTDWCRRHGLRASAGSAVVLRAGEGPTLSLAHAAGSEETARQAGASAARLAGEGPLVIVVPTSFGTDPGTLAGALVEGALLASYRFRNPPTSPITVVVAGVPLPSVAVHDAIETSIVEKQTIAEAANWARHIINTPAVVMPPKELAREVESFLARLEGVRVEVWTESRIREERLGGVLAVGAGSAQPCRVVRAEYVPRAEGPTPHVVLVGKGVTFDSGGLSLKPSAMMTLQKTDMSGAAIVTGALAALAALGTRVRVTMIALMAENMTGPAAMRPGDVLTIRDGQTIEVLNTDAEGRLLLADGLSLAAELAPDVIVDVATLTGAQRVALGNDVGALFATDDELAAALTSAGEASGEALWRMPLVDAYEPHLESEYADMNNQGVAGQAGSVTAALLLRRFTKGLPWAHLDIAGPGRSDAARGYLSKGGTAFSLRTLVRWITSLETGR